MSTLMWAEKKVTSTVIGSKNQRTLDLYWIFATVHRFRIKKCGSRGGSKSFNATSEWLAFDQALQKKKIAGAKISIQRNGLQK